MAKKKKQTKTTTYDYDPNTKLGRYLQNSGEYLTYIPQKGYWINQNRKERLAKEKAERNKSAAQRTYERMVEEYNQDPEGYWLRNDPEGFQEQNMLRQHQIAADQRRQVEAWRKNNALYNGLNSQGNGMVNYASGKIMGPAMNSLSGGANSLMDNAYNQVNGRPLIALNGQGQGLLDTYYGKQAGITRAGLMGQGNGLDGWLNGKAKQNSKREWEDYLKNNQDAIKTDLLTGSKNRGRPHQDYTGALKNADYQDKKAYNDYIRDNQDAIKAEAAEGNRMLSRGTKEYAGKVNNAMFRYNQAVDEYNRDKEGYWLRNDPERERERVVLGNRIDAGRTRAVTNRIPEYKQNRMMVGGFNAWADSTSNYVNATLEKEAQNAVAEQRAQQPTYDADYRSYQYAVNNGLKGMNLYDFSRYFLVQNEAIKAGKYNGETNPYMMNMAGKKAMSESYRKKQQDLMARADQADADFRAAQEAYKPGQQWIGVANMLGYSEEDLDSILNNAEQFFEHNYSKDAWEETLQDEEGREYARAYVFDQIMPVKYEDLQLTEEEKRRLDAAIDAVFAAEDVGGPKIMETRENVNEDRKLANAYGALADQADAAMQVDEAIEQAKAWTDEFPEDGLYDPKYAKPVSSVPIPVKRVGHTTERNIANMLYNGLGEYVNGIAYSYQVEGNETDMAYIVMNRDAKNDDDPYLVSKYAFATPDMRNKFNELYKHDRDNGTNYATEFLKGIDSYLEQMKKVYTDWYIREAASDPTQAVQMRIDAVKQNMTGGFTAAASIPFALAGVDSAKNTNSLWFRNSRMSQVTRDQQNNLSDDAVTDMIVSLVPDDKKAKWRNIVKGKTQFLLNVADSITDNLVAMGMAKGLTGDAASKWGMRLVQLIMSGEATGNTLMRLLDENVDPGEAAVKAIGDGVIEWFTEKVGLDALLKDNMLKTLTSKSARAAFIAKNMLTEGSEEINADLLNMGLDMIVSAVNGHEDELQKRYAEIVAQLESEGMKDPEEISREAWKRTLEEKVTEIGMSGLAGALSGGLMAEGRMQINSMNYNQNGTRILNTEGRLNELIQTGLKNETDSETYKEAMKLNQKMESGKKISAMEAGKFAELMKQEAAATIAEARQLDAERRAGKKVTRNVTKAKFESAVRTLEAVSEVKVKQEGDRSQTGAQWASQDDIRLAESESEHIDQKSREVILDGKFAKIGEAVMEDITDEDGNTSKRLAFKIDGTNKTVDARTLAATDFVTAAIMRDASAGNPGLYTADYVNHLMKLNTERKIGNVGSFLMEANTLRIAGMFGMNEQALQQTALPRAVADSILTQAMEERGRTRLSNVQASKSQAKQGSVTLNGVKYTPGTLQWTKQLDKMQLDKNARAQVEAISDIAMKAGIELTFKTGEETADYIEQYGKNRDDAELFYGWQQGNTVTVNLDGIDVVQINGEKTKNPHHMLVTFGHEMTHWLKENSLNGYNRLEQYVINRISKGNLRLFQQQVMQEMQRKGVDLETAVDELVADSCDNVLSDEKVIEHIQETDSKLYNDLRQFVSTLVEKVKNAIKGMKSSQSIESLSMAEYANELNKLWTGAYDEALSKEIEGVKQQADPLGYAIENKKPRFSMSQAVEMRNDDLMAVHNLNEDGMEHNIELGGFVMPSIGVVNHNKYWSLFGKMSVFFGREVVDPRIKGNHLFSGDAYTPVLTGTNFHTAEEAMAHMKAQPIRDVAHMVNLTDSLTEFRRINSIEQAKRNADKTPGEILNETKSSKQEVRQQEAQLWDQIQQEAEQQDDWIEKVEYDRSVARAILFGMEAIEATENLTEADKTAIVRDALVKQFKADNVNLDAGQFSDDVVNAMLQFAEDTIAQNPSLMQESKPETVVQFNQVRALVVPQDIDQSLIDQMVELGLDRNVIHYYDENAKTGPNSREAVVMSMKNTQPGVRFSTAQQERLELLPDPETGERSKEITDDSGNELATVLPGGTVSVDPRFSYSSWVIDKDRTRVENALKKLGYKPDEIKNYLRDVNTVANWIAQDRQRLDYQADRTQRFMKKNSDVYKYSLDASTLCAKRLLYQGTLNAIMKQLPNTALQPGDMIDLANMMHEMGFQTPCGICYVESRRRNTGNAAKQFLENYQGEYIPNYQELTTTDGLAKLKQEHRQAYDDFIKAMNKRGAGSVKIVQTRTDYRGEIRRMGKRTVAALNAIGGLRVQSFSDFETPHMIDMMQAVVDMNLKGLKSQAYTKVSNFAWVFGATGIKINLSLMGDVAYDKNGKAYLIFDNREGMDFDEAMKLRDAYSSNVGTILVGRSKAHILAAMADDRIDFIIPFHKSGWTKEDFAKMKTLQGYEDFQDWQNERTIEGYTKDGKPVYKNVKSNIDPLSYWRYDLSGKENAQIYLDMCEKQGIVPKFNNFLHDNGDGSWSMQEDGSTDGYWKMLIDFKMYDNEGYGAPQEVVQPNFNMEQARRVMNAYEGGANQLQTADPVVERFVKEYKTNHPEQVRFSSMTREQMDVNSWIKGLTPSKALTEGELQLASQYRGIQSSIDLQLKAISDLRREIAKIEAKENPTIEDTDALTMLRNRLDIRNEKLAKYEDQLHEALSERGFATMMYRNAQVYENMVEGKTQAQVQAAVDSMVQEVQRSEKAIAKQVKELQAMEEESAIKTVKRLMNRGMQNKMVTEIKKQFNTAMTADELKGRMAELVLRSVNNEDIMPQVEALAQDITDNQTGFGNEEAENRLSLYRGMTIEVNAAQLQALKAMNMSLKDIRAMTRGSGIKFRKSTNNTLEHNWQDMTNADPSLAEKVEKSSDALPQFAQYIQGILQMRKGQSAAGQIDMSELEATILATVQLAQNADNGGMTPAEIQEAIKRDAGKILKQLEAMQTVQSSVELMKKSSERAQVWAEKLGDDMSGAIDYYNKVARLAAEQERQRVKRDVIDKLRSENTRKLIEQQEKYKQLMKDDRTARELAADNLMIRKQLHTVASRIANRLFAETDLKNVPEEAKPLARQVLQLLVNHDSLNRKATFFNRKQLNDMDQRLLKMTATFGGFNADTDLNWLIHGEDDTADTEVKEAAQQALADIRDGLLAYRMAEGRGTQTLSDRKEALTKVQEATSRIWSIIQARSEADIRGRKIQILDLAQMMEEDMADSRFKGERKGFGTKVRNAVTGSLNYGNMTPEYFFKNLKNRAIDLLKSGLNDAENRSGLEAAKAQARLSEIAKRNGYADWDGQEKHLVETNRGAVEMTTEQIMALYATWLREGNALRPEETSHLLHGGFVLAEKENNKGLPGREKKTQRPIRMSKDQLGMLGEYLTPQQKQYVDDVVAYMSGELAELGNEASMKMYGIKKFTEQYYFPIKSWGGVLNSRSDAGVSSSNENRAAQQGFSKRVKPNAKNAIEIADFTPTAAKHVTGMITYNTIGPAIENINKVLNQQLQYGEVMYGPDGEELEDNRYKRNMRAAFEEAYGKQAMKYLKTFMKDMNGGVGNQTGTTLYDKLLGMFKKSAVAGSLSVAAQQPLSYIRAAMMVNPKYLAAAWNPADIAKTKAIVAEMRKYSGVAVIKQIGKFDMTMGKTIQDFITPEGMESKWKKIRTGISDAATALPGMMDTFTWARIWTAVKAQQMAENKGADYTSDAFMQKVADKFNELMRRTQVYDSVMVRSQNMRNQHAHMKTITSFMAEPTLSLNVLADAFQNINEKGGKANAAKAVATFLLSAAAQAAVKGFFTTGRSPDKKKTMEENFLYRFAYNLINEANPLGLIPGYNNLIDLLTNGEVKDNSLSVVGKFKDVFENVQKLVTPGEEKKWYRLVEDSVGQALQLFSNVPLKNIMRDFRAMVNIFSNGEAEALTGGTYAQRPTSSAVLKYQTLNLIHSEDLFGVINKYLGDAGYGTDAADYYERIYSAQKAGDNQKADEMKEYVTLTGKGKDPEGAMNEALRKMAREDEDLSGEDKARFMMENGATEKSQGDYVISQVRKGEISADEARKLLKEIHPEKSDDDIWWQVDRADYERETGEDIGSTSKYHRFKYAIENGKQDDMTAAVENMVKHGMQKKDIKSWIGNEKTGFKTAYLNATGDEKNKLRQKLIKAFKAVGMTETEAISTINGWKPKKQ